MCVRGRIPTGLYRPGVFASKIYFLVLGGGGRVFSFPLVGKGKGKKECSGAEPCRR